MVGKNKDYDIVCTVDELYSINVGEDPDFELWRRVTKMVNLGTVDIDKRIMVYDTSRHIVVGFVLGACPGYRDKEFILTGVDDCSHAWIIKDIKDIKKSFGSGSYSIVIESDYHAKVNRVRAKFADRRNGSFDIDAAVARLVELGEGDN